VTPATPTVVPAMVPLVCVPCPSSAVSSEVKSVHVALPLPVTAWLYQSQPRMRRPANSGWLKSTPVSIEPITTSPPPAAMPSRASSSASSVDALLEASGPVRPCASL
jgi:hypothetical protein